MKIIKIVEFLCKNHEDHENHRIPREKPQNNENIVILQNNFKHYEHNRIPYENAEN